MCLSISITATPDVNHTHFKRAIASATSMSVYSNDRGGSGVFYVGDAHCACDMLESSLREGTAIEIAPSVGPELVKIAEVLIQYELAPFELRVSLGNETASESVDMDLAGLRELIGANSFDGRVAYIVGRR